MPKSLLRVVLTLLAFVALGASLVQARSLTLDERIAAHEAIERVYYSHQVGAKKPFEEAVPSEVLRRKVVRYLKQSKALEQFWHTPVTAEMLEHELQRMIAGSQMPGRLQELFAALDHDSFLIQECLARATLVDRLTRNFQASDEPPWESWWSTVSPQLDENMVATVAQPGVLVPLMNTLDGICATDETWDNGALDDVPLPQYEHTAVWTGSRMLIWGGCEQASCFSGHQTRNGYQYDPATDSWTPISTTGAPSARYEHTAIWTGSRMVIWGGDDGRFTDTGGRYDPLTDSWAATTTVGVPSARFGHTAVWTGSEMLIWGGEHEQPDPYAGGRYDPVADRWVLISNTNAPSRREHHSAIWTGIEMIVWGATADLSGGVYNPSTDSWLLTSPIGAPSVRSRHTAIWTGDRMLIWGGSDTNTGGLYDPVTETWTPTSTVDAPAPRWYHTGVWTGSEMLVWGGWNDSQMHDTGGRYDPVADSWTPTTTAGAPSPRVAHAAVWTGSLMLVWGGVDCREYPCSYFNTGGRYDPVSDSWTPTSTAGAPSRRYGHTAVWTGSQMIIWGGQILGTWEDYDVYRNTGGRYDPATDIWTPTSIVDAPSPRTDHTAIWTGNRMVIWGGADGWEEFDTGGGYDPVADQWTATSTENAPYVAREHTALWTGSLMLTWTAEHGTYSDSGGRYDPEANSWLRITNEGEPPSRDGHTAVWTGSEMIIWGGHSGLDPLPGRRYDPELDRWTPVSTVGAPSSRYEHTAVWTGDVMVVWGGDASWDENHFPLNDGGKYDPATDSWSEIDDWQVPSPRYGHTAVWTGNEMLVWGGRDNDGNLNTGAWFELFFEHWWPFSLVDAPVPRREFTAVWSGSHMIVWGGLGDYELDNGGRYAMGHTDDADGDGLSECDGDCNDDNPWIYPDALEVCDGFDNQCPGDAGHGVIDLNCNRDGDDFCDAQMVSVGFPAICAGGGGDCDDDDPLLFPNSPEWNDGIDNQCPGDPGYGVIDETSGNCGFNNPNDKSEYSWPAQPGAVQYEVVRSGRPDFNSGCTFLTTTETAIVAEDPEVGETHFYLNRPVAPFIGSWGQNSSLQERFPPCAGGVASINFQPDHSALPAWHQKDWGQTFDEELGYGWSVPITGNTRERDLLAEQQLDTFVFSQAVQEWNLALPVGTYAINFISGDAAYPQGPQQVVVEGITAMDGVTMPAGEFWAISVCADVGDGNVTIEIGGQAGNTILNSMFVEPDSCAPGTVIVEGIFTP